MLVDNYNIYENGIQLEMFYFWT